METTEENPSEELPIENISDTARWVAVYRAVESERGDALFHDPFARKLAGKRGEGIVRAIPGGQAFVAWSVVVRTRVIDELLLEAVRDRGVDAVLNLAAGLDTRPYRLPLPPQLHWYEVDLPEISSYKETTLAAHTPNCRLSRIALDLSRGEARRELLDRIAAENRRVLVLTEGILMYLTVAQVDELARELASRPAFAFWMQDYVAKPALQLFNVLWHRTLGQGNSKFQFMNREGRAFFTRRGWREVAYRSFINEAGRLKRDLPLGWLARAADRVSPLHLGRESGGILLLEREG